MNDYKSSYTFPVFDAGKLNTGCGSKTEMSPNLSSDSVELNNPTAKVKVYRISIQSYQKLIKTKLLDFIGFRPDFLLEIMDELLISRVDSIWRPTQ